MVHPILDQYYDRSPHHRRSTAFVRTKGLLANEKGTSRAGTPFNLSAPIPCIPCLPQFQEHHQEPKQRFRGPTIPTLPPSSLCRSRTPDDFSAAIIPRSRTPLAHAEPAPTTEPAAAPATPFDVRALTAPPAPHTANQQQPAQGNIKKKRSSLSALDASYWNASPAVAEPARSEYGNPNKIAQMFPELALQ